MNRTIIAALFVLAAGQSVADDITIDNQRFHSQRSRAEVRAELDAFKRAGVNPWSTQYNPLSAFHGERSRSDVREEYLANRAQYDAMHAESGGAPDVSRPAMRHGADAVARSGSAQ